MVTNTARIAVETNGERVACKPGRANPRHPGSSPIWAIKGIDQAYAEDQEQACYRAEALAWDSNACRQIEQNGEPVDRQRKSDGHHVPVPPHAPADHSKAKFLESSSALGEWSNDQSGDERPKRPEQPERHKPQVIT
jgi:hypothetical protein